MSKLFLQLRKQKPAYKDRHFKGTQEEYDKALSESKTVYVGNLGFQTPEPVIYELFSKCGAIKRVIMGLDQFQRTPCGFAFVEFFSREAALNAANYINRTRLDDRPIRVDIDYGYEKNREFGRGQHGGQVRDEYRTYNDPERGGRVKRRPLPTSNQTEETSFHQPQGTTAMDIGSDVAPNSTSQAINESPQLEQPSATRIKYNNDNGEEPIHDS